MQAALHREKQICLILLIKANHLNTITLLVFSFSIQISREFNPFTDEAQPALFKDPVRTAL